MLAANAAFTAKWGTCECSWLIHSAHGTERTILDVPDAKGQENLNIGRAGAASFFLFNAVYAFTVSFVQRAC